MGTVAESKTVLECIWNISEDTISLKIPEKVLGKLTKRIILSMLAENWDPLGILVGVIITGRLIFLSIVRLKLGWDEEINESSLIQKWNAFLDEMTKCKDIKINRCLFYSTLGDCDNERHDLKYSLIGFSDGSNVAHGCVLYLRWSNKDESIVKVHFVAAKGKVAPIKGITTPRNELCGALLLARLTATVLKAMENTVIPVTSDDMKLFSDSTTVLAWVKSDATKFKRFVKNKIVELQDLLPAKVWNCIPSRYNKAVDAISKGCSSGELQEIIDGPEILKGLEMLGQTVPTKSYVEKID